MSTYLPDAEIVALYHARDEQAIRESENKYGTYCHTVAMNILENLSDAEECVNDTWLRAWNAMPPHRPTVLRTFLGKITRNLSINRLHRRNAAKRRAGLEVAFEELGECVTLPEDTGADELCALLDAFLEETPKLDRQLFLGRYWFAHSVGALARHYGMTENAVSQRLKRTRAALRQYLEKEGYHV